MADAYLCLDDNASRLSDAVGVLDGDALLLGDIVCILDNNVSSLSDGFLDFYEADEDLAGRGGSRGGEVGGFGGEGSAI